MVLLHFMGTVFVEREKGFRDRTVVIHPLSQI
jgi:hypothetical protein